MTALRIESTKTMPMRVIVEFDNDYQALSPENKSLNSLTVRDNPSKLSSTSQVETGKSGDKTMNTDIEKKVTAIKKVFGEGVNQDFINEVLNGTAQMPASRKKELDKAMGVKKEAKELHHMINHREDGSFGVKIPFDMKDAFKKQFSSAKWDGASKEWTVGKLSGQKLNTWLQDKIPHIEESNAKKADFDAKKSEMHPLTGKTFDLKDELKEKFGAVYDGDAKTWRVPPEHKDAAQQFVSEHNAKQKEARAAKRNIDNAPLTAEENARVEKWIDENPHNEDLMMDDKYMRTIAKGGEIKERSGFGR